MKYLILVMMVLLAGCGSSNQEGALGAAEDAIPNTPQSPTLPTPTPSVTTTPPPSCKSLFSTWSTATTPDNQLLGVYVGPPTNGPIYKLDLTQLHTGLNTFKADATHSCMYDITLGVNSYTVNSFQGCNPGVIPPGGTVNDQCSYCPYYTDSNIHYTYQLNCNSLSIFDSQGNQTVVYF